MKHFVFNRNLGDSKFNFKGNFELNKSSCRGRFATARKSNVLCRGRFATARKKSNQAGVVSKHP
jgi:hypothetical protein